MALHGVFQLAPRSPGGRVVALGASFVATIVICMYIAAYSAQITVQNLPKVADISQLYGKPVGIWEVIMEQSTYMVKKCSTHGPCMAKSSWVTINLFPSRS